MAEKEVPDIVDKLGPVQVIRKRRMGLDFMVAGHGRTSESDREERSIYMDALEYVEVFSEDAFCRLMARHALGRRPR